LLWLSKETCGQAGGQAAGGFGHENASATESDAR